MMLSLQGSSVYPTVQSPTTPGQQTYAGGFTDWSRASYIPSPRWQGPSSYAPLILPQGVVSVPGWSAYSVSSFILFRGHKQEIQRQYYSMLWLIIRHTISGLC